MQVLIAFILSKIISFAPNYVMHMFNTMYVFIVKVRYWINSSKTVVQIDRPMEELSMHIRDNYLKFS